MVGGKRDDGVRERGFSNMAVLMFVGVLCMDMSRKFKI
jgi:hypothetical protein